MGEHALFSGAAERSVALGSSGHVEFARDRLHLVEFVRWGVVPESRWQLDDELGCLRSVGRLVHAGRGCLELGVPMQPARDSIGEGHLDIECGYPQGISPLRRLSGAARIELRVGEAAGPRWLDVTLFDQNLHRVALMGQPWLQPSKSGARAAAMLSVPFGFAPFHNAGIEPLDYQPDNPPVADAGRGSAGTARAWQPRRLSEWMGENSARSGRRGRDTGPLRSSE